eukprot:CAMPEP_0173183844 /NCGR_PEP_ID=MMETSP1141-20130122/8621_1 /TAXON_ID=483371 /ORGANISM="non described non described, Strain CCMP2298" /LENGTH=252 /DNA_ID=CAMNT_0014107099 /DNA_START=8 /DNA_END=767 /DNA_ORIENTATION=-
MVVGVASESRHLQLPQLRSQLQQQLIALHVAQGYVQEVDLRLFAHRRHFRLHLCYHTSELLQLPVYQPQLRAPRLLQLVVLARVHLALLLELTDLLALALHQVLDHPAQCVSPAPVFADHLGAQVVCQVLQLALRVALHLLPLRRCLEDDRVQAALQLSARLGGIVLPPHQHLLRHPCVVPQNQVLLRNLLELLFGLLQRAPHAVRVVDDLLLKVLLLRLLLEADLVYDEVQLGMQLVVAVAQLYARLQRLL